MKGVCRDTQVLPAGPDNSLVGPAGLVRPGPAVGGRGRYGAAQSGPLIS